MPSRGPQNITHFIVIKVICEHSGRCSTIARAVNSANRETTVSSSCKNRKCQTS